jgi:hypothetical protein
LASSLEANLIKNLLKIRALIVQTSIESTATQEQECRDLLRGVPAANERQFVVLAQGQLDCPQTRQFQADRLSLNSVCRPREGAAPDQRRNARVNALDSEYPSDAAMSVNESRVLSSSWQDGLEANLIQNLLKIRAPIVQTSTKSTAMQEQECRDFLRGTPAAQEHDAQGAT